MERLQKIIASSGYCSRRKAEDLIKAGKVELNGKIVTEMGVQASINDDIVVDGNQISKKEDKVYYLLNKPRGVVTTVSDDKNRKTVIDLIDTDKRIYPVGRLDYDTTGALILTNDGEFANLIMHPSNEIDKQYVAKIKGIVTSDQIKKLKSGIKLDGKKIKPSRVKVKKIDKKNMSSIVEITIHDGKNHEVKRLFEAIGYEVIKLKRESISFLNVDNLKSGESRMLSIKEVKQLYSKINKK